MGKLSPRRVCELDLPMRQETFAWHIPPGSVAVLDRQKFAARRHARARTLTCGTACGRDKRHVELHRRLLRHVSARRAPLSLDEARYRACLAQRDLAASDGRHHRSEHLRNVIERRQVERNGAVFAWRNESLHTQPQRCPVARLCQLDCFARQRLRLALQKRFGRERRPIARALLRAPFGRPAGLPDCPARTAGPRRCFSPVLSPSIIRPV